jgi:hypothetical protein
MDFTSLRPAAGVWSAASLFLFHSSLLHSVLTNGYTCCSCGSDGAWSDIGELGILVADWLTGLAWWSSCFDLERVVCCYRVRGSHSASA